jgi:hypothetical protein
MKTLLAGPPGRPQSPRLTCVANQQQLLRKTVNPPKP